MQPSLGHSAEFRLMREEVVKVLRAAKAAVPAGGPRPLYNLTAVSGGLGGRVRHGFPIIAACRAADEEEAPVWDVDRFKACLASCAPWLEGFDLRGAGMVLAGGSVSAILARGSVKAGSDFDIYLAGCNEPLGAITSLAAHLDSYFGGSMVVHRSRACVTFMGYEGTGGRRREVKVQVILCVYESLGEVLYSFDLGASAMAWDGEDVYLSEAGSFALRRRANILWLPARNGSYEYRLEKYFDRGFDLILPELDEEIALEGELHIIELPYLRISGAGSIEERGCNCLIEAWSICASGEAWKTSQYEDWVATDDPTAVLRRNLRALRAGTPHKFCALAPFAPDSSLEALVPIISAEAVRGQAVKAICNLRYVNVGLLRDALTDEGCKEVLSLILGAKEEIETAVSAWAAKREMLLEMPFVIAATKGASDLFEAFPRSAVTGAEWYGEAYRKRLRI